MSELPSITERIEAFRETEIPWLVKELGDSIANLGYPVGMGIAPHPVQLRRAAEALFERWCKMASKIAGFAPAQRALPDRERIAVGEAMTKTTPIQLANAIDEMSEKPKGGKMAAIAYRQAAKLIRTKLVDPATEDAQLAARLRDLLRRAISYGGIEPQLDQEIKDALLIPCRVCGGSGFSGYGTGYDAVCGECGGQQFEPPLGSPLSPTQPPMLADIAQIIDAGWKAGRSSADVAGEILREFDGPAVTSTDNSGAK